MYQRPTPKYVFWTPSAIECYMRNCICADCLIKEYFDSVTTEKYKPKCKMKQTILELVKNVGKPTEEMIKRVYKDSIEDITNATSTTI